MTDPGAVEAARKIVGATFSTANVESELAQIIESSTQVVLLREQNAELWSRLDALLEKWELYYRAYTEPYFKVTKKPDAMQGLRQCIDELRAAILSKVKGQFWAGSRFPPHHPPARKEGNRDKFRLLGG